MNYFPILVLTFSICFSAVIKPENGSELTYVHILFEWEQEPNAISYNLQVSNQISPYEIMLDVENLTTIYIDTENFNWDNSYFFRIRPIYEDESFGEWSELLSFTIKEKQFPERVPDIYNEDLLQEGLVAFGGFAPDIGSAVIDEYGNEIWNSGESDVFGFMLNHINEFGNIYGLCTYDFPNNTGSKINYDLDILWSAPTPDPQYPVDSHEIKQIPNGNYMAFVPDYMLGPIPPGNWSWYYEGIGYQADGVTIEYPWMGMRIVEWDEEGNEVWDWNPFEHFTMNDYDAYGGIWWDFEAGYHDWMHSNAFYFDEEESVIYVSHRHLSRLSKISYPSGEVLWNIGMPAEYGTGNNNICTDLGNSFQHHIQLMDDGSLLFFDNGNLSQMLLDDPYPTTRVRRIRVVDNSYCITEWEYELPPNLFGLGMGSVQLLDNGNYLIYTFGSGQGQGQPTIREISPNNELIWNYQGFQYAAWYRAYKIPSLHPEAFSVIANNYIIEDNQDVINLIDDALHFTIFNESGYSLEYRYMLSDLMDGGSQLFMYNEGVVSIDPYGSEELSFFTNSEADIAETQIMLTIWPVHHDYAVKELIFGILPDNTIQGDINLDGEVNVLDVVSVINIVLSEQYDALADFNGDNVNNILDIVLLIDIILN